MAYVDGFIVAVPKKNLDAYRRLARKAGKIWREYGALDYREWVRKHPVECVVGAAAAGFILAGPAGAGREDGRATLLDEFTRAGFDTALQLFLKTLV